MTSYTISLDDMDLALLPTRIYGNDFLKKDHYEFQLLTREETEGPEDALYTCHICAIDVPSAFLDEHNASTKHEANVRIAAEANQRMRALLTARPPPRTRPTGRYCDACAAIVDKDHDKTKEHKLAVIQDRMLWDLMNIYVGDDEKRGEKKGVTDKHKHAANVYANVNDATKASETEQPKNLIAEDIDNRQGHAMNGNAKPTHFKLDTDTYIDILMFMGRNNNDSKVALKCVDDKIQMHLNNERINVSHDHFHGYHRFEGKIQCRVCYTTLPIEQEEMHKLSHVHMTRLMRIGNDGDCIRQIYENWSHCIICNQVVKNLNVDAHKQTNIHIDRKREATVSQQENPSNTVSKIKEVEAKPSFSSVASTSGITANKTIPVPNQMPQSNNKYAVNPKPVKNPTYKAAVEKNLIEYPYKKTDDFQSVYCVLCQCKVPSNPSNREAHLKGMRHSNSVKNAKKE